jgi:hypothetical protein
VADHEGRKAKARVELGRRDDGRLRCNLDAVEMTKLMSTSEPVTACSVSWMSPENLSSSQSLASLLGTPIRKVPPSAEMTEVFLSHMS